MSSLIRRYEEWYRQNSSWFTPVEESLRTMTVFLPGRFSTSELESELVYTFLNLVGLYHDRILDRQRGAPTVLDLRCADNSTCVRAAKRLLIFTHYTEVLFEMIGRRMYPNDALVTLPALPVPIKKTAVRGKMAIIASVEIFKALLRIFLLLRNNGRILLLPTREQMAAEAFNRKAAHLQSDISKLKIQQSSTQNGSVSSVPLSVPDLDAFQDLINLYILHGRDAADSAGSAGPSELGGPPKANPHGQFSAYTNPAKAERNFGEEKREMEYRPNALQVLAEMLNILRPVVYAVGQLLSEHPESWSPWCASFATELLSRLLVGGNVTGDISNLTTNQKLEVSKRVTGWWLYMARTPFFDKYTRVVLVKVFGLLARLPLVGGIFGGILELILAIQSYYFYTSGSS